MRVRRLRLGFVLLVTVGGIVWLALRRPGPQTVVLPDGSRLTLFKATCGTNHLCRFGHRWQDVLYPILPPKLRWRLSPRVLEWSSFNRDSVMVWFRRDGLPAAGAEATRLYLSVADEHGLESPLQLMAHTTRTTGSTTTTNAAGTQFSGWELADYPKRSRQFRVLVYRPADTRLSRVGEFLVPNPVRRNFPVWTAEPLPASRRTNELEVTLTRLETGMAGPPSGAAPVGMAARTFSRASFKLRDNGLPTKNWSVSKIRLSSATGESRFGDRKGTCWWNDRQTADVWGGIWLEEPAWKLDVDFARTASFPVADLWGIQGVRVPEPGETVEHRVETNLHAVRLEFLGVGGLKKVPTAQGSPSYAVVRVRTQYPLDGLDVLLVEARDDRGRIAPPHGATNSISTGAGGNTPKESLTGFRVEIPDGAKSLDITLAATPVRHVQFLARPVMFERPAKAAD
jgi:hypothetical protein